MCVSGSISSQCSGSCCPKYRRHCGSASCLPAFSFGKSVTCDLLKGKQGSDPAQRQELTATIIEYSGLERTPRSHRAQLLPACQMNPLHTLETQHSFLKDLLPYCLEMIFLQHEEICKYNWEEIFVCWTISPANVSKCTLTSTHLNWSLEHCWNTKVKNSQQHHLKCLEGMH